MNTVMSSHHLTLLDKAKATPALLSNWSHNRLALSALSVLSAGVIALTLPAAYRDYQLYMSLGPAGPPHNVVGWLCVKLFFDPFRREPLSTALYDRKVQQGETARFLDNLPPRKEKRPQIGPFAAPNRQLDQLPSRETKEKLMQAYEAFLERNSHVVDRVPSILERYTDAAHVSKEVPLTPVAKQMRREVCHIHGTGDHSVHVTLSPADCKTVIESGWGQRFPLAGSSALRNITLGRLSVIPSEYVLIYAPRDDEEIEVVMRIIKASVQYVTGAPDVN